MFHSLMSFVTIIVHFCVVCLPGPLRNASTCDSWACFGNLLSIITCYTAKTTQFPASHYALHFSATRAVQLLGRWLSFSPIHDDAPLPFLMWRFQHIHPRGRHYIQGGPKNCTSYCFLTNCATVCANKACFVRFECDTRSITQTYNILD